MSYTEDFRAEMREAAEGMLRIKDAFEIHFGAISKKLSKEETRANSSIASDEKAGGTYLFQFNKDGQNFKVMVGYDYLSAGFNILLSNNITGAFANTIKGLVRQAGNGSLYSVERGEIALEA